MIEFRHLRHFVAVAEELHFARAAERLGMEQSPLSHSIKNLEADLGVQLFHRTTRRTWLTRAGTRFLADARRILHDVDAAKARISDKASEGPCEVRLALGDYLAGEPFTRLLFELEHHHPNARVDIREASYTDAVRLLREGVADVAVAIDDRAEPGLMRRRGWGEPLMVIVPLGHQFADRDKVKLREVASERVAMPATSICPGYVNQIEALFARNGIAIGARACVRHWNTAVSFASTGRAIALTPLSFVNGTTSVAIVPLAEPDAELVTWLHYADAEPSLAVSLVLDFAALIDGDREVGV